MSQTVDWKYLQDQLGHQLATSLQGLVQGAAADIQTFANAISAELVVALSTGDKNAVRELQAQLRLIAEKNRIKAVQGKEQFVFQLISVALNAATGGLLAAGAKLGKGSAS